MGETYVQNGKNVDLEWQNKRQRMQEGWMDCSAGTLPLYPARQEDVRQKNAATLFRGIAIVRGEVCGRQDDVRKDHLAERVVGATRHVECNQPVWGSLIQARNKRKGDGRACLGRRHLGRQSRVVKPEGMMNWERVTCSASALRPAFPSRERSAP